MPASSLLRARKDGLAYYKKTSLAQAQALAERWTSPSRHDMLMYLMKGMINEYVVTRFLL